MSEEEGPLYKDGDIVWVKLGPTWWPGEVTDKAPEDYVSKKPPLAIVKFFNEDTYEFVKTQGNIYSYNCDRKNEFITKGMNSFRANNTHMNKFPGDVSLAEIRTGGNPNILTDPMFAPQKKTNVIAEVFGTTSPKKTPKEAKNRTKNSNKKPKLNITHRRFLGCDDYESRVLVQYPGKDGEHLSSDEEIKRLNAEPSTNFDCKRCGFNTKRLEVMWFHVQCHINGIESVKKSPKKKKKRTFKHITSENDRSSALDSDSDEEVKKPKRKRATGPRKRKPKKIETSTVDIRNDLLAEWSDGEENEEDSSKLETSGEIREEKSDDDNKEKEKDKDKSCFDFDDEEEDSGIVHTAVGRKIPRVIPPSEKRKSTEENEASLPIAEDDENRMEIMKVTETNDDISKEEEIFKDLMESTSVPELLDVPQKNFSEGKSVKVPDKKSDTEVATKLTNPKKRFVKSFEDFELLQNEQRRAQEEKEEKEKAKVEEAAKEEKEKKEEVEAEEKKEEVEGENEKKEETGLEISKLKNKIMLKLGDEDDGKVKNAKNEEDPKRKSHRTPRSKILESYIYDTNKEDSEKEKSHSKKSKILKYSEEEPEKEKVEEDKTQEEIPKIEEEKTHEEEEEKNEKVEEDPQEETEKNEEPTTVEEKSEVDKTQEEIAKIDEYLSDFFEYPKPEEKPEEAEKKDEVHIKCAVNEETDDGGLDFNIKTNLTNLNKDENEMSALSTLAMVSELEEKPEEKEEKNDEIASFENKAEMVPIDGNLTVVSEKDLADGQVEITANASPTCKKPVTLTNFSMDFSECNSNSTTNSITDSSSEPEEKPKETKTMSDAFDLEEHIPSQIVDKPQPEVVAPSKLLERLIEPKPSPGGATKPKVPTKDSTKVSPKAKIVVKTPKSGKPIILSDKIIKPVKAETSSVSVQKVTSKRNLQDPDEIDTYIIQKGVKNQEEEEDETPAKKMKKGGMDPKKLQVSSSATSVKKRGKAKILQQTIITPAGEIIQPTVTTPSTVSVTQDDNVFDINSMPIVLSDQILTPESIENMPIYLSDGVSTGETPKVQTATIVKKAPSTLNQPMRVLNKSIASTGKLMKNPKIIGTVSSSKIIKHNSFAAGSKQGKYLIVNQSSTQSTPSKYTVGKKPFIKKIGESVSTLAKLQGVPQEPSGNKIMILTDQQGQQQRVLLTPAQQKMMGYSGKVTKTLVKGNIIQKKEISTPGSSGLITKTTPRVNSQIGQILTPGKTVRIEKTSTPTPTRKLQIQTQKVPIKAPQQKTILIKNQHGQTVRKIQGTDDALLDKQVAEQIEAIKASGALQKQELANYKTPPKPIRRPLPKKPEPKIQKPKEPAVPPLAPISPKKTEEKSDSKPERALHQLVIQDSMGNQTTITEGQILALPSETVDGQPQSYMLVTLDESGNLTPLNNEALLSLDPNLGLGGDLSNTVLQIDQNALKPETSTATPATVEAPPEEKKEEKQEPVTASEPIQAMSETGQQLIVTGDPIAAQKFLESLTEGNTDLANILASAEGSSILIHADGQQILINTDSDNQMLLSVNSDNSNLTETSEGGGNPIFATQPKNQDILAAALADTDFQQEQTKSQLSPNSIYPMNVGNVLETSLTLNSPIMTPLEVPSTNSKKIDESDILNQVPKNVDLPITITDPNISQTVSQQQMMSNELQGNLELALPIETTTAEINSPNYGYLPMEKPFNSSMPLLTEDESGEKEAEVEEMKKGFLDESEGLCTLGGEMCSSLSEPPPDMFDLSAVLSSSAIKGEGPKEEKGAESVNENEDSCEIPVQPEIVTSLDGGEK